MSVLISGWKGNLGSRLVDSLSEHDSIIKYGRAEAILKDSDLNFDSVSTVIHCAYDLKNKVEDCPDKLVESNLLATMRLLRLTPKKSRFVFISSV